MVEKWGIYFVNLDTVQGSEQKGKRPVLVISNEAVNQYLPVCTIIPFSSYNVNDKIYPTEILLTRQVTSLIKESILMIQQIRTIDQSRIIGIKVGKIIDDSIRDEINNKIKEYFDL